MDAQRQVVENLRSSIYVDDPRKRAFELQQSTLLSQSRPQRCTTSRLPDARLEEQVGAALEADAGLEERLERVALAVEAVHDVRACAQRSKYWSRISTARRYAPGLTSGALSMYERSESTEYSGWKSAPADASRYCTRVSSSVRIARSRMSGVARRES